MPETRSPDDALDTLLERETRIDLAARLDCALDTPAIPDPRQDEALRPLLALASELHASLHRPLLTDRQRQQIRARAHALAARRTGGLRRGWPQLATHPAVVGGAAAAFLAAVGIAAAAMRDRRAHPDSHPILGVA